MQKTDSTGSPDDFPVLTGTDIVQKIFKAGGLDVFKPIALGQGAFACARVD